MWKGTVFLGVVHVPLNIVQTNHVGVFDFGHSCNFLTDLFFGVAVHFNREEFEGNSLACGFMGTKLDFGKT